MKFQRIGTAMAMIALISGCGGGGSNSGASAPPIAGPTPTPPAPPPTSTAGCSLSERQNWAGGVLNEWYLFPETLPTNRTPTQSSVEGYIDYLTANARAQGRDRYFTYLTSIAEENAYYNSGSTAGLGLRLSADTTQRRIYVTEAYEGAPGQNAGIDRGAEILAIGTTAGNLQTVDSLIASGGTGAVVNALGPDDPGVSRVLRIRDASGTRDVTVAKAYFELLPVSSRYGARIIDDGGSRVGYVNLRTFISTADPALRAAFAQFKQAGITNIIVDLRYNGGGLVSIAELMGDLLGGNRSPTDVFSRTLFRAEKSQLNETDFFTPRPESVSPTRIAFIGRGGTASASELVINSFIPYLGSNMALVGTNTYGKPVGQIAIDRPQCDDRLRVIAFRTVNANNQGDYYNGLAATVPNSCQAGDDISRQLGDPQESSTRQALDFLAGRSCTPIGSGTSTLAVGGGRELLSPERPQTVQREAPGSF